MRPQRMDLIILYSIISQLNIDRYCVVRVELSYEMPFLFIDCYFIRLICELLPRIEVMNGPLNIRLLPRLISDLSFACSVLRYE